MFLKHVSKDLSAYCHGQLSEAAQKAVAGHLLRCARCRREYEEIRLGVELAGTLPLVSAPESLWSGIERRLGDATAIVSIETPLSRRRRARTWLLPAAAALLVGLGLWATLARRPAAPGSWWDVARLEGLPRLDSDGLQDRGKLKVGGRLETDAASRAEVRVADIGRLEMEPETSLRLVETGPDGHRLALDRGAIRARVTAPPRLFLVETPTAVAVDLGCAYRLSVEIDGGSLLHVTSGWVALEAPGRESLVPAGALCRTRPSAGPGTPYFEDASPELKASLDALDFGGGGLDALGAVLAGARRKDTLTLWHLIPRVAPEHRGILFDGMVSLVDPPRGLTRAAVIDLDGEALDRWKKDLRKYW